MKTRSVLGFLFILYVSVNAGESLFGINDKTIGFLSTPYSSNGMSRSYEAAIIDSQRINFLNYSTWTDIAHTSYSVKLGYHASFGNDKSNENLFNDVANFEGGYIAIPLISNKMAFVLGLFPYTTLDQRLSQETLGETHTLKEDLLLRGGLSKAVINLSYNLTNSIFLGLGYEYTFGKIIKSYRIEYINSTVIPLSFEVENRFYGHGIVASAAYRVNNSLSIGGTFRPGIDADLLIKGNTNSEEVNKAKEKKISLPAQFNLGFEYKIGDRLKSGMDISYQGWKDSYKIDNTSYPEYYNNYFRIGWGIERTQSSKLFVKFSEQLDYKLGLYYSQLNMSSNGNAVSEYGLTLGCSFPIQRFISKIDLSAIVGKRGDLGSNYYKENFIGFGFSIHASEIWFQNIDE